MIIRGRDRRDWLTGGIEDDTLLGLGGDDTLTGGAGNDILDGGTGADLMQGGTGHDTYHVDASGDRAEETAGQGNDHVIASLSWTLGAELERLSLTGTANINGTGNALANTLVGNRGANTLDGGAGADILSGGNGHDTLLGGAGNDRLDGGSGNDILDGGAGKDTLKGGIGSDTFVFRLSANGQSETALGAERDVITHFTQGEDRIDLSAFESAANLAFIGTKAFVPGAGPQLRYEVSNGVTILQLDITTPGGAPDGRADAEIAVMNTFTPNLADFIGVVAPPIVVAPPPPPPGTYPAGAIRIAVGSDAQALVNGAPEGATFWFEAGVHRLVSITPKNGQTFLGDDAAVISGAKVLSGFAQDGAAWVVGGQTQQGFRHALEEMMPGFDHAGFPNVVFMDHKPLKAVDTRAELSAGEYYFDYAADRIYLGDNPAGRLVEAAVSPYAFAGTATKVTIQGLTIEKYASPIQHGAIGHNYKPVDWTIKDNEVRLNFGVGILGGDSTEIIGNHVHNNGEMGLGASGADVLIENNEIAANGFWSGIDVLWEGGGGKFAVTDGLVVRGNFSHDNNGYGLWTDIDNTNTLYENNRLERNSTGGINHEISYDAVIRNNTFSGNGADVPQWLWGAAIQIQNSSGVEIYGNTIDMTGAGNGITLIQQDRGGGPLGSYVTTDNYVHNNVMISRDDDRGAFGAVADALEDVMLGGGNRFDRNEYHVTSGGDDHWAWGDFYDWNSYRATTGQDLNSQLFIV